MAAAVAAAFVMVEPAAAAPITIVTLNIFHANSSNNCEDTTSGTGCSPLGVTHAGSLLNPFLNNTSTKEIELGFGSYYLFGNPYAPTSFMTAGNTATLFASLHDPDSEFYATLKIANGTVPDLSVAGTVLFNIKDVSEGYSIVVSTTGITNADRMSFGYPPTAFAPDGNLDFVLQLTYGPIISAVPEPASWLVLLSSCGLLGGALRRGRAKRRRA
ncbi:MAG: PEP-CTERM sorting domain-containing protein [Acetobacteraceae bacterium]